MTDLPAGLAITIGRAVEGGRDRIGEELGRTSGWVRWLVAGALGALGCVVCDSVTKTELHHVAGKYNSDLVVPVCELCHARLSERQNGWDPRWQREGNSPTLKESLLVRGLSDLCEERARFHGAPAHELGKRLRATYATLARATA